MIRLKRSLVLLGAAAFVALLVAIAYAYFMGTQRVLQYAEDFALRRMTVSYLTEQGAYRFFYATNRVPVESTAGLDERFSSQRGEQLSFGSFDTEIDTRLRLGMLINPSDWLINDGIRIQNLSAQQQPDLLGQLREQVEASPRRSLLIVLHGFREAFPSAVRKTAFLAHVLDIDTPVLLFDWPGDQGSSLRGYRRARSVAKASAADLAALLRLVVEQVQPQRLWLMANSMGGEVVVGAFEELAADPAFADAETEIENVMLTAPDVDRDAFNQRFSHALKALVSNTTVYVSSNDRALLVSRLINRGMRLGESTLDPGNPDQSVVAGDVLQLLEPGDERVVLVDVTPVNRTRNFHNFSLETPEFFDDLFVRFVGYGLPESRELYPVDTAEGERYFVLTRGR